MQKLFHHFVILSTLLIPSPGFGQNTADSVKPPVLWQVKYNMAAMGRGDYELSCERQNRLNDGIEIALGATFRNNIFEETQQRLFNPYYTGMAARENRPGYSIKAAYKHFFHAARNGGFYMSPQLAHIRYNFRFPLVNIDVADKGYQKENITYNEARFLLGYQYYAYNNKLSFEINIGAGIKHRNISFIEEESYYDLTGNYQTAYGTYTSAKNVAGLYTGVKIGWNIYEKKK